MCIRQRRLHALDSLQSCWDKSRGWMQRPRSELKMGVGGWSRSMGTGKLSWNICFSFPTFFLMKISFLYTAKTKTHFSLARHISVDHKGILSYLNLVSEKMTFLSRSVQLIPNNTLHSNPKLMTENKNLDSFMFKTSCPKDRKDWILCLNCSEAASKTWKKHFLLCFLSFGKRHTLLQESC